MSLNETAWHKWNWNMRLLACFLFLLPVNSVLGDSFYDFSVKNAAGEVVDLAKYKGKVTLVTNVASYCGFTDNHYRDYVKLQEELGSIFQILAFPCNQFGQQEPEDVQTIIASMKEKYSINFEIFDKVDVIGDQAADFWKYLAEKSHTTPDWNFYKYLVAADGQVWGGFGPKVEISQARGYINDAVRLARKQLHGEL